jgi:GGDEF domain-containing protein
MSSRTSTRRVLWVAADEALRGVLEHTPQAGWEGRIANSFEKARFLQQLDPSDVIILGGSPGEEEVSRAGLSYLGVRRTAPLLFVADVAPESVRHALIEGADAWLPRQTVLQCPSLLLAALDRLTILPGQARGSGARLPAQRRTSRLVNLLWETLPGSDLAPWFSQRHTLDRLHEEIARCSRHGGVFSLILGELQTRGRPASARRTAWAARLISASKRRSDIVGQYGPSGFLLVLPNTAREAAEQVRHRLDVLLQRPREATAKRWPRFRSGLAGYQPGDTALNLLCRAEKHLEKNPMDESYGYLS